MKLILLIFLFCSGLLADIKDDIANARARYVQAIFNDDKKAEIINLKKLIELSKKGSEDTSQLEKNLSLLEDELEDEKSFPIKKEPSINHSELFANINTTRAKPNITTANKIIVLDAGHGGKDSGAVGPNGEQEKHVVLSITKTLGAILRSRGYQVFLTRDDDHFVELKDRTAMANKKDVKIFVSIHANAAPGEAAKRAKGIETYFLSPARDERAKRVASLENGVDMSDMNQMGKSVFLDVFNRGKITLSHKLAIDVQRSMKFHASTMYKDTLDNGVREGPFWVLVGAQSAAILVEVGYISHPEESQKLINPQYQEKIAFGIADGINSYFVNNP